MVAHPIETRKALDDISALSPMAVKTWLALTRPLEQAEPLLTAMPSRSRAIIMASELVPGRLKKLVLLTRGVFKPWMMREGVASMSFFSIESRSADRRFCSVVRLVCAVRAAPPKAAIPAVFCVPARALFSCPPPCSRVGVVPQEPRASAPTPCGPPILWAERLRKSAPRLVISRGSFPAACVASQCRKIP